MRSLGLDISRTRTGAVICTARGGKSLDLCFRTSIVVDRKKYANSMTHAAAIADEVGTLINVYKPDVAVVEGYSLGSKFQLAGLVEVGTMVRWVLLVKMGHYIDVAPSSLKKFVLLKGKGEKDQMMMEVFARWGIKPENNDEGDAIGLSAVGLADAGKLIVPKEGREVLGVAKHYHWKK